MEELLNNAPCGFITVMDGGEIAEINATLLAILGYEREEIVGVPADKIFSAAGRIFYQTHFFPLLKLKGKVAEIYLSLRSKDGRNIPVLVNALRADRGGVVVNDFIFVEMHQRYEYETEILKAKKEAEAAIIARDEFMQVVSHELRTPLTAILGWSGIIGRGNLDAEKLKKAAETIASSVNAQNRLIEDILDHARINSGKMKLRVGPVSLGMVITEAINVVTPAANARDINLQIVSEGEDEIILADADRLQQVLWNLLQNSVKFTPKGGNIWVKIERGESNVEISVIDTGDGISADFLPYVFDRLRQAGNGPQGRSAGLGLGLAITRSIVELHGGSIRVESGGKGLGATFTVTLPSRPQYPQEPGTRTETGLNLHAPPERDYSPEQ